MPPLSTQELSLDTIYFGLGQHQSHCSSHLKGPISCASSPRTKKRVMFHDVVKAKKTIHILDFTRAETQACWYTARDLKTMKKDVREEARVLEDECLLGGGTARSIYLVGLDVFTPKGSKRRNENKKIGQAAVLEEQYLQKKEGTHDPDFIAMLYCEAARASRLASIEAARV